MGFENICEFLYAVSTQLNMLIAVERMAVNHRYLSELRLQVMADRDGRWSGNSLEAFHQIVVQNIVGLVGDYVEGILSCVTDELVDVVDGRVFRDLVAYIRQMLAECLAKNRIGTLAKASDMNV